jgi:hypothetical protein
MAHVHPLRVGAGARARALVALVATATVMLVLLAPSSASAQVPRDPVPSSLNNVCIPATTICITNLATFVNGVWNPVADTANGAVERIPVALWNVQQIVAATQRCVNATIANTRC